MCSRSSDPFYIVTYYIDWVTTSWTYSISYVFTVSLLCLLSVSYIMVVFLSFCPSAAFMDSLSLFHYRGHRDYRESITETPLTISAFVSTDNKDIYGKVLKIYSFLPIKFMVIILDANLRDV